MTVFPAEMESERLRYERLHPDDVDPLEFYRHVRADAPNIQAVTRYLDWEPYQHPKEAQEWIEHCGEKFDRGDDATYTLRALDGDYAGELIGLAALHPDWDRRLASMGVWLRKSVWGNGYSAERAGRLLELAFDRLDLEVVVITHDPENRKSARAIERYVKRFGGRKVGRIRNDTVVDGRPRDSIRYSISRAEWEQNRE